MGYRSFIAGIGYVTSWKTIKPRIGDNIRSQGRMKGTIGAIVASNDFLFCVRMATPSASLM